MALDFVDAATPIDPLDKLDPTLTAAATVAAAGAAGRPDLAGAEDDDGGAEPTVDVLVSVDQHLDPEATAAQLAELGEVVEATARRVRVRTVPSRLAEVAALDGVLRAEVEPDAHTQNNVARTLTHAEPVAVNLGLDGDGEIVGVADSGLDTGVAATVLPDFAGRVVNIRATVVKAPANGADLNNHGTHVSGSILGDGANSNGNLRGMAPAARLTMLSMGPNNSTGLSVPADLVTGVFTDAYNDGARIHSNSWGSNNNLGKYTAFSEDVDDFVFQHPDMLVVIAAGNSGPNPSTVERAGHGQELPHGGGVGERAAAAGQHHDQPQPPGQRPQPGHAAHQRAADAQRHRRAGRQPRRHRRLLGAGAGQRRRRHPHQARHRGPRHVHPLVPLDREHGRHRARRPEAHAQHRLVLRGRRRRGAEPRRGGGPRPARRAVLRDVEPGHPRGAGRLGPLAQQNYFYDSGTSMATPITSGAVALLRQYLREQRGIANPSAALMKALIVNAAALPAAAPTAPDNNRGFGWLDVERLLTPATGPQAYSDDVDLAVATGDVRQLSVQVADPAQPLRVTLAWTDRPGKGLQNHLYLRLVPPGGGAPIDGDITAFPTATNNVQRVHVAAPAAGTWTVEVHGVDVPFGIPALAPALRQDFALAVTNGIGFSPKPVDVSQVVDHSGSMGFYSFMAPARERTKQLVDVLRINDRTGVVQFDHAAATVAPVAAIAGAPTQAALRAAIDTITPAGATSIGGGLAQGVADLAAGGDPAHPQAIVLVSDGHENTPPWVGGGITNSPPAWYTGPT